MECLCMKVLYSKVEYGNMVIVMGIAFNTLYYKGICILTF